MQKKISGTKLVKKNCSEHYPAKLNYERPCMEAGIEKKEEILIFSPGKNTVPY